MLSSVRCRGAKWKGLGIAALLALAPAASALAAPPAEPLLLAPAEGAVANGTVVSFEWTLDPSATDACIQLAIDPDFTLLLVDACLGGPFRSVDVQGFPDNGLPIFWRIIAVGADGSSVSVPGQFVNGPSAAPEVASALMPADGVNAPGSDVLFSWEPAPRAANYLFELFVGQPGSGSEIAIVQANLGNLSGVTVTGLPNRGDTFFWRLTADNAVGAGPGVVQSFVNGPGATFARVGKRPVAGHVVKPGNSVVIVLDDAVLRASDEVVEIRAAP